MQPLLQVKVTLNLPAQIHAQVFCVFFFLGLSKNIVEASSSGQFVFRLLSVTAVCYGHLFYRNRFLTANFNNTYLRTVRNKCHIDCEVLTKIVKLISFNF